MSVQIEDRIYRRKGGRLRVRLPDGKGGEKSGGQFPDTSNGLEQARAARDTGLRDANILEGAEEPDRITDKEDLNTRTVGSTHPGITSCDELLKLCKVDLDVWVPYRQLVNKWPVGGKVKTGKLSFDAGKVSGDIEYKGIQVTPLIQVKVWLRRIHPISAFPTIQPVHVGATYKPPKTYNLSGGLKRALIFCDTHIGYKKNVRTSKLDPFHDRYALDLLVQLAEYANPDRIDGLGDILDLADWADKFQKLPEFYDTTQPSVLEAHWHLKQLRHAAPNAQITLYAGNHEERIRRAQLTNLRASFGLKAADEVDLPEPFSPARLLGLSGLGIDWISEYPDGESWLGEHIQLKHGTVAAATTARTIITHSYHSVIYAHSHRRERFCRVINTPDGPMVIEAASPGCMCRTDYVVPGHTKTQHWQKGLAMVDYTESGRLFNIQLIPISMDGCLIYDGRLFTATNRLNDIMTDLPGWMW